MALKVTSGAWQAASEENKEQRNTLREQFFSQAGIKPAKSMREVHFPLASRLNKLAPQLDITKNNRLSDDGLKECAELAEAMITLSGLGIPSLTPRPESQTLGLLALSPEVLKRFFITDQETAFERSLF